MRVVAVGMDCRHKQGVCGAGVCESDGSDGADTGACFGVLQGYAGEES